MNNRCTNSLNFRWTWESTPNISVVFGNKKSKVLYAHNIFWNWEENTRKKFWKKLKIKILKKKIQKNFSEKMTKNFKAALIISRFRQKWQKIGVKMNSFWWFWKNKYHCNPPPTLRFIPESIFHVCYVASYQATVRYGPSLL